VQIGRDGGLLPASLELHLQNLEHENMAMMASSKSEDVTSFRNQMEVGLCGKQIRLEDPGDPIALFQSSLMFSKQLGALRSRATPL